MSNLVDVLRAANELRRALFEGAAQSEATWQAIRSQVAAVLGEWNEKGNEAEQVLGALKHLLSTREADRQRATELEAKLMAERARASALETHYAGLIRRVGEAVQHLAGPLQKPAEQKPPEQTETAAPPAAATEPCTEARA